MKNCLLVLAVLALMLDVTPAFTADAAGGPEQVQAVKLTSKGKTLALAKNPDGWAITDPPNLGPRPHIKG